MRRASVLAGALFVLAWLLRVPFADDLRLMSDDLDPFTGALLVLQTGDPLAWADPIFPYGRELTALPLVLGADSLLEIAQRRGLLQALLAPLTVLAVALLIHRPDDRRAGTLLGPAVAGVVVAAHPGLLRILSADFQGYFSPEWGSIFVLALVVLARSERPALRIGGALLLGVSAMFAVSSSPYALALGGVALPVAVADVRARGRRGLGVWAGAVAIAGLLALPHVLHVLGGPANSMGGEGDTLLQAMRSRGSLQGAGIAETAGYYLSVPLGGASLALLVTPVLVLLAARRLDDPVLPRLAAGLLLADAAGIGLSLVTNHSMPWHWLPLLPAHAALLGALVAALLDAARTRGTATFAGVAVALACLPIPTVHAGASRSAAASLPPTAYAMGVAHAARVSRATTPAAHWVGFTLPDPDLDVPIPSQEYPLALDAWLAQRPSAWSAPPDLAGGVVVYSEGPPAVLDTLAEGGLPPAAHITLAGTRFLALEFADAAQARAWVLRLCAADPELVRIAPVDPLGLPAHRYVEEPLFETDCAGERPGDPTEIQGLHPDVRGDPVEEP